MCFSAQADIFAGIAIGTVALDTRRHVSHRREIPLAAIPLVFTTHQFTEALIWWGLGGQVAPSVGRAALWLYLVVAFGVLPVLVPVAVLTLEPSAARRRIMTVFAAVGCLVALALLVTIVRGPIGAHIQGHHIAYDVYPSYGFHLTALYVLVTCGPMLTSSHRQVVWFGLVNLVAVGLLAWLSQSGFISLWCTWAALTCVAIDLHLRRSEEPSALASAFS
jgi:hypothetical protein